MQRETDTIESLDLSYIDPNDHQRAIEAFENKSAMGILCLFDNQLGMYFIRDNIVPLLQQGIYESALFYAFVDCRANWASWTTNAIKQLFAFADKQRLRNIGDKLPGKGPFTLYRGVSGTGWKKKIRGISWTASFEKAKWFAERLALICPGPEVYKAVVPEKYVYAYYNGRNEQEFMCNIPKHLKLERVWPK